MHLTRRTLAHAIAIVVVLGGIAAVTPQPGSTDRDFYQRMGHRVLIRDCGDIHCFRTLVAVVLEHVPGPSDLKWKTYAVLANAIGALAVGRFCSLLGLSASVATAASWISALGAGSLYSVYNCYTSDALMYMLGPLMAVAVWEGRPARAGVLGAIGVFAKEFAAAPLWIFTAMTVLTHRFRAAVRLLPISSAVTLAWLTLQAGLMAFQNYRYGSTRSAEWFSGAFLATWMNSVGSLAVTYLFISFGALYLLLPVGLFLGGRDLRRLAVAAVPAIAAFVYLEQPERAIWNFHFIVIPIAAVALQGLPDWAIATFAASFGIANLRFGAQLPIRSAARVSLLLSLTVAAATVLLSLWRRTSRPINAPSQNLDASVTKTRRWSIATEAVAFAMLATVMLDVHAHRRDERRFGVNQWGYRGPLETAAHTGIRIAFLGGSAAFGVAMPWQDTVAAQLASELNSRRHWNAPNEPFASVDNLAEPGAHAGSYIATLRDYEYLHPDIVCMYDGDGVSDDSQRYAGRRASFVFRHIGYLPVSPAVWVTPVRPAPTSSAAVQTPEDDADHSCTGASAAYCDAIRATVRFALERRRDVVVAIPPHVSAWAEARQKSLAEALGREFGAEPRFHYVDLGRAIDVRDPELSEDRVHLTGAGAGKTAARLADVILDVMAKRAQEQGS